MKKLSGLGSKIASQGILGLLKWRELYRKLNAREATALLQHWRLWAGPGQLPPDDANWRTWLFMGGRGAGKTRAGAEWVKELVRLKSCGRIALVAPTMHDAREVMIEGASGLMSGEGPFPKVEPSRRRLVWPNGAVAQYFSAEDPPSLRGPQFDAAWGDELAYWPYAEETLKTLRLGLRIGKKPRLALTTTPRPMKFLRAMVGDRNVAVTRAETLANKRNLSRDFIESLQTRYSGSVYERQELLGELIADPEGALWKRADVESARLSGHVEYDRIVVAIDPSTSIGPDAHTCGIIAAGAYGSGARRSAVVLGDSSVQGASPHDWAKKAVALANSVNAHAIVAEANNGGELVRSMLALVEPNLPIRIVYASSGKRARAEPVATLYSQRRVFHAETFAALEDEMCSFGAKDFTGSADRVDALVWALTDLVLDRKTPRVRVL